MATSIPERIQQLLGKGIAQSIVASAVGCDPSYVSQLMEEEEFRMKVMELRAGGAEKALGRDEMWDSVEEKALEKALAHINLITRPQDLIRLASMANAAKRTAKELAGNDNVPSQIVQLIMPESAVINFQMNAEAQVVQVDGRSMAALPTNKLQEAMKERTQERVSAGTVDVVVPTAVLTERKKVMSILEQIGGLDAAIEDVPNVMSTSN